MNKITVRNRYTDVLSFFHAILIQCLDTKEMVLQVHACTPICNEHIYISFRDPVPCYG